jgi:Ser/Thr protein kinase RdoA (MazF antagonist)
MKLTKKDILEIAKKFNLGIVRDYKIIKGGLVNYNYFLRTDKSRYILRGIRDNNAKGLKHLRLQFKIFNYLSKKEFPYLIPQPLKADNNEIVEIRGKMVWVYGMIKGQNRKEPNLLQIKQMAVALATYHKFIKGLKGEHIHDDAERRIRSGFKKMKEINVKNETDKLALKYRDYFENIYKSLNKTNNGTNKLFLHGDFDSSNVLFDKGKLVAIIDFDDVSYEPRIYDISVTIRDSCCTRGKFDIKKAKVLLKEYEKISKLSKKEKNRIIPLMLHANVDFFVWAYNFMKKEPENKKKYMKEMIKLTKDIVENNKEIK